jgi:polyferredoxin
VVAAIAIKRPFCRVICPIGAIYAPFNKVSLLRMTLKTRACRGCTLCTKVCPMNISVYEDPNQLECIRCFECKWACRHTDIRITC